MLGLLNNQKDHIKIWKLSSNKWIDCVSFTILHEWYQGYVLALTFCQKEKTTWLENCIRYSHPMQTLYFKDVYTQEHFFCN